MADDARTLIEQAAEARRSGNQARAVQLAEDAIERARSAADTIALGEALAALARLRRDQRQLDAAAGLYEESAAIARQTGDDAALAHRLRHVGDIVADQGELDRAERCYEETGRLFEAHGTGALNRANFVRSVALLREKQGARAAAAELWGEARALYAATGIDAGVQESDRRLAQLRPV